MNDRNGPVPALDIRLFGPFETWVRGRPLRPLRTRKGQWLLALLSLRHGHDVPRDWLAGLLWPDSQESQLLSNLRRTLTDLRDALGEEASSLQSPTAKTLRLDLCRDVWVDVADFDDAVESSSIPRLEEAVRLYRGPLLEGCMEEWVFQERLQHEHGWLRALEALARDAVERGNHRQAVSYLQRLLLADPLREEGHRLLIQAQAGAGDYAAMIQAYRQLRAHLRRELNADPAPETTALVRQLREEMRRKGQVVLSQSSAEGKQMTEASEGLAPAAAVPHNLPTPLTSFIGRENEQEDVKSGLASFRLVTLMGAGGIGKSRLALQVASEVRNEYPDGVWWIELAALSDGALVPHAVASVLGIKEEPTRPIVQTLTEALRDRAILLVLDNCEHLAEACASLASGLLSACSNLRLVATSRTMLNVQGEAAWRVPSLSLPGLDDPPSDKTISQSTHMAYDAVRLFVERALVRHPSFLVTTGNAPVILQICRRLDGIPLAIELAAVRTQMLSVAQIAERLSSPFQLLSRGNQGAPQRHQTLRATLDWSFDLLSPPERALLRRLSVFAEGWTMEAAEVILPEPSNPGDNGQLPTHISREKVLDLLSSLVENSLVVCEDGIDGRVRHSLLEIVRQYAADRLQDAGEAETVKVRHADYFVALAQEAASHLRGPEQTAWLDCLEIEHGNLRAVLRTCPENVKILRVAASLARFWRARGYVSEGRAHLRRALSQPDTQDQNEARMRAHQAAGVLAWSQGDYVIAQVHLEECLAVARDLCSEPDIASALHHLGLVAWNQGRLASARGLLAEALDIRRALNDRSDIAYSLDGLGLVAREQGDYAAARKFRSEGLALLRELGDKQALAGILQNMAVTEQCDGDLAEARALYETSLGHYRELGNKAGVAVSLYNLGTLLSALGDIESAYTRYEESRIRYEEVGDKRGVALSFVGLATVSHERHDNVAARAQYRESLMRLSALGDRRNIAVVLELTAFLDLAEENIVRGARILGAAETLRDTIGAPLTPGEQEEYDRMTGGTGPYRRHLEFARAWEEGSLMSLEQVIAFVLEDMAIGGLATQSRPPARS
jgi:predicted ATPase/DNA-binding SARP family transcriptional activator